MSWECDIDDDCGDNSDEGTNYCCELSHYYCYYLLDLNSKSTENTKQGNDEGGDPRNDKATHMYKTLEKKKTNKWKMKK